MPPAGRGIILAEWTGRWHGWMGLVRRHPLFTPHLPQKLRRARHIPTAMFANDVPVRDPPGLYRAAVSRST